MEHSGWSTAGSIRFPNGRWEMVLSRALHRELRGRTEFALPYSPVQCWQLPELFCFARAEELNGRAYIIYAFDEKKAPIF